MGISVEKDKCTGCEMCVSACPFGLIDVIDGMAVIKLEGCNLCGACVEACAFEAIRIEKEIEQALYGDEHKGVWVFAEQRDGEIKSVAYELLAKGRELADALKTELCAICIGSGIKGVEHLMEQGADKVYVIDDPALVNQTEDPYVAELARLARQYKPEIILAGATPFGRSFFPRVAAQLQTGLTADCTGLEIDTEKKLLRQTRPTFGGNIMATIICPTKRPQMATVRPRVFKRSTLHGSHAGQIIRLDFNKEGVTSKTKLLNFVADLAEKVKLEDADIIVSGGRGLGKPENFHLVRELAAALGAAVGSSRPPVDEGWISYPHQVGQTGKTVCPRLYIAVGISGAVQHLAGMGTADCIIAINNDPDAPIFQVATYGLIGDLFKIVPLLTERLKGN
ncbi:MAG: electron transfer flavoprotein subunit alpha [Dehalococcoidia bacterium]|nr:electron transfer flavoprotein subunit alpha [Dehalococcoidia bacterium]